MNGEYLADNLGPLKFIGNGVMFNFISDFLNEINNERKAPAKLVAYQINNCHSPIIRVNCLFKTENGLLFRNYDYFADISKVDGVLKIKAEYGVGIIEYNLDDFFELRKFYTESRAEKKGAKKDGDHQRTGATTRNG